ncbi:unnamed protein product [Lasius platythorax]|uniref:Uncharacterized protein n=1 Tax=Lasius platythorax TaxID=488582 RepID=A0AAV2NEG8_9HYME
MHLSRKRGQRASILRGSEFFQCPRRNPREIPPYVSANSEHTRYTHSLVPFDGRRRKPWHVGEQQELPKHDFTAALRETAPPRRAFYVASPSRWPTKQSPPPLIDHPRPTIRASLHRVAAARS